MLLSNSYNLALCQTLGVDILLLMIDPHPIYIVAPVWPFASLWVANNASTHHLTTLIKLILNVIFIRMVLCRYTSTQSSFAQSSYLGSLTLVVRNFITVCISVRNLAVVNSICTTEWWKCYFSRLFQKLHCVIVSHFEHILCGRCLSHSLNLFC